MRKFSELAKHTKTYFHNEELNKEKARLDYFYKTEPLLQIASLF